jgi:hypothetical protein
MKKGKLTARTLRIENDLLNTFITGLLLSGWKFLIRKDLSVVKRSNSFMEDQ